MYFAVGAKMKSGFLPLEVPVLLFFLDEDDQVVVVRKNLFAICHPKAAITRKFIALDVNHDAAHLIVLLLRVRLRIVRLRIVLITLLGKLKLTSTPKSASTRRIVHKHRVLPR